jgi:hypothetical protein
MPFENILPSAVAELIVVHYQAGRIEHFEPYRDSRASGKASAN